MLNLLAIQAKNYDLSNLEKYKIVETICRIEKAKAKFDLQKRLTLRKQNLSIADYQEKNNLYSDKLKQVLDCLSESSQNIIKNEFLFSKEIFWYEKYFSKTTYYKKRKEAVDEFLAYYIDYNDLT